MKNFHSPGDTIDVVPTADGAGGKLLVVGDLVCVACGDHKAGVSTPARAEGVFDLSKGAGAIAAGARIYATAAGVATAASSGNKSCGFATVAAASADATVRVKLAL